MERVLVLSTVVRGRGGMLQCVTDSHEIVVADESLVARPWGVRCGGSGCKTRRGFSSRSRVSIVNPINTH
jgi:hypothetical protein